MGEMALHFEPGMDVRWGELPSAGHGSQVSVSADYSNARAGHHLPSGDPERFILVKLSASGTDGAELASATARVGSRYQWWPDVRLLEDNRMKPGETRTLDLAFQLPEEGALLRLEAEHWRISEENLRYHGLEGKVPTHRVFFSEERRIGAAAGQ